MDLYPEYGSQGQSLREYIYSETAKGYNPIHPRKPTVHLTCIIISFDRFDKTTVAMEALYTLG